MKKSFLMMAITTLVVAGCTDKPGKGEPGYDLLSSRCYRCHATGVKKAHTTKEEWETTINRMIGKGASLNEAEKATLVDFLVKHYHP